MSPRRKIHPYVISRKHSPRRTTALAETFDRKLAIKFAQALQNKDRKTLISIRCVPSSVRDDNWFLIKNEAQIDNYFKQNG